MSVWFVTGASRGFGAEIVEKAFAAGHSVVATARDPHAVAARFPDAGDQLLPVALDVLDEAQAAAAVEAAVQRFGRIDVVVNDAQPGDPVKAAAAIVEIASAERPPLRIQLGRDSFGAVADKLQFVAEEQQAWRDLSVQDPSAERELVCEIFAIFRT